MTQSRPEPWSRASLLGGEGEQASALPQSGHRPPVPPPAPPRVRSSSSPAHAWPPPGAFARGQWQPRRRSLQWSTQSDLSGDDREIRLLPGDSQAEELSQAERRSPPTGGSRGWIPCRAHRPCPAGSPEGPRGLALLLCPSCSPQSAPGLPPLLLTLPTSVPPGPTSPSSRPRAQAPAQCPLPVATRRSVSASTRRLRSSVGP